MAWLVEDRRREQIAKGEPLLTEEMKNHLRERYFPRYPTKRAALLPALHHVQHAYGWIPAQAMQEIGEFLERVDDTIPAWRIPSARWPSS